MTSIPFTRISALRSVSLAGAFALALFGGPVNAQQPATDSLETQRAAMRKLSFLAGDWSGPLTVTQGPGQTAQLTQTEHIEFKLDGLVLLIEGQSIAADGTVPFKALATIAYDDEAHAYRFHAYHDGRYVDTELAVQPDGFSWGFDSGPVHIVNTMRLTPAREWHETTEVTLPNGPPHKSVEMTLNRRP
jgi:hypothetical protein